MTQLLIRRALVSVYDKTGLAELAGALTAAGVEIVSTGSTAGVIAAAGVPVTRVEEVTGFPECLDGRVKTLHPGVHAGLLADPGQPAHQEQLGALGIAPFELLVVNLYPFEATVAGGAPPAECVEQIDIGGPAMVRAAAKNHARVAVITGPAAYPDVVTALAAGGFTLPQRRRLAAQAYALTARYDAAVASWFASEYAPDDTARETGWPDVVAGLWTRHDVLRYGENPHQGAALYTRPGVPAGLATAEVLHGKAMSYNNYTDAAAARRAAFDFSSPCVAIIKHANPCGIAIGADLAEAHRKAHACDPVSAYGGVIAANGVITLAMADQVADIFTEVIVAPGYEEAALRVLTAKKNLRLLRCPAPEPGRGPRPGVGRSRVAPARRRHADADARPARRPRRRPGGLGAQGRPRGLPGHGGRPGLRLAGLPGGEVQRDRDRQRRRHGRGGHGPGQPGGPGQARGRPLRRAEQGRGGRERRLLPVRGRVRRPGRRRGPRRG